jgi:hypothetical protein
VSDHNHESYEVYGLDTYRQDAAQALALIGGLREDLGRAEMAIRDLAERVSDLEQVTEDRP